MGSRQARGAQEFVPDSRKLGALRTAAASCRGCELYSDATQAVFGDGPARAKAVFVGEQPGDAEDTAGEPFVGPAGRLLDKALADSGINRKDVYVTNAVKHFKFTRSARGKARLHKKPSRTEVVACRPWLEAELDAVRPGLVVLLGATAAQSVFGSSFRITQHRGEVLTVPDDVDGREPNAVVTVHPSSVLRSPDRDTAYSGMVDDLCVAASLL